MSNPIFDRRTLLKAVGGLSASMLLDPTHLLAGTPTLADQEFHADDESQAQGSARAIELRPDDVTVIRASRGSLSGNLSLHGKAFAYGFDTPQDQIVWTVNAPKEDDYAVSLVYNVLQQRKIEVRCGKSILTVPALILDDLFMWRQEIPGTLHLKTGKNKVTLRLPDARPAGASEGDSNAEVALKDSGFHVPKSFNLRSIELGTPAARKSQLVRAKEIRGDASWMIDGKYGQFIHWSAQSYPLYGNEKRAEWFQKSVEIFDVKVFADAVERSGPAWVTFTATHQGFYWPGPNAALDKILPGRTAQRDLLGEIIDELGRRNIRTLLYLHTGYNGYESEFWKASGAADADRKRFSNNIAAIMRDCSLRYGKKLSGFGYIDGAFSYMYLLDPSWEGWAHAIKAGNPAALVGYSSNKGPTVSPFSELAVTDGHWALTRPDPMLIGPGRQLGDVTSAAWFCMDKDGWISHKPMNGTISRGPAHSTQEYVDYFQRMAAAKVPVTVNMIMTADVTNQHPLFNPKCTTVMEQVRKAIRGA